MEEFIEIFGVIFGMGLAIVIIVLLIVIPFGWNSAKVEARLYNQKFNTTYTTSDFFWAGDTVKSYVNKGEQKTFNLNVE